MQRVKVIETFIIADHLHCNCFFIDTGKSDTVNSENLYVCGFEFGKIAPQAICFNLNGFEELQNCPHITNVFNAWLNGKYFQGCVSITENQYRMQSYRDVTKIPITLFSSYPKLSLLRPMLMEHIGETLPKPEFSFDFTNAKVTHIEANGIIYFHLDRSSVKYIDSQIENTVKEQRHSAKRQMLKKSTKIGLIRDNKQNKYFRARITANNNGSTFQCYFMDYGFTKSVAHFDIFVIDEDSILSHYPSQAVPAKLNSVSVFDEIVLQRLHSILPVGTNVKVKAVKLNDKYPMVIVHKREMNINELIHMEVELREYVFMEFTRVNFDKITFIILSISVLTYHFRTIHHPMNNGNGRQSPPDIHFKIDDFR